MDRAPNGRILPNTRTSNGQRERLCKGPGHDEPTWLPETAKYFWQRKTGRQAGTYVSQCRLCKNWTRVKSPGLSGYVPDHIVRPYVVEGVHKVGLAEFSRRVGRNSSVLKQIIEQPFKKKQKRFVRRVMLEVISIRRKGEVRHRTDIAAGRLARGLPDNHTVTSSDDLYQPLGDDYQDRLDREAKFKRDKRASLPSAELEEVRRRDRDRRRAPV